MEYETQETHYFDKIDSEEKAYFLGLLLTDGWVTDRVLGIELHEDDAVILEHLRSVMGSNHPVSHTKKRSVRLQISNKDLVTSLARYGMVPAKSLSAVPPTIAPELQCHFWRGCFDGDGSIGFIKPRDTIYPRLYFVGSKLMVEGFRDFAASVCPSLKATVRPKSGCNCFEFQLVGQTALEVARRLYSNASVFLPRKYNRYLEFEQMTA